jgi:hypothetical protein
MRAKLPPWFAALLIALSPSAFAINMVTNPDFDADTSGWTLLPQSGGGVYRDCCFGSPNDGTLRLDAFAPGAIAEATQCVDIHKWTITGIDFAMRYFADASAGTHLFQLQIYDTAGCTGTLLDTIYPDEGAAVAQPGDPATGWFEAGDYGYTLPTRALSALLDVNATGTAAGNASYFVDHVQVGPLDVIFVDDFDGD